MRKRWKTGAAAGLACLLLTGCAAAEPAGRQEAQDPVLQEDREASLWKEDENMTEREEKDPEETARRVLTAVYTIDCRHPAEKRWDRVRGDLTKAYGILFEKTLQQEAEYEQTVTVGDCYRKEGAGGETVLLFSCEIRMEEADWGSCSGVWWVEVCLQEEDGAPKVSSIRLMPREDFRDLAVTA